MKHTRSLPQILLMGILFVPTAHISAADGTLDTTFGNNGFVKTQVAGAIGSNWVSVKILSNGTIVAAGLTQINGSALTVLGRYLSSGTFDPSFNNGNLLIKQFANAGGLSIFDAVAVDTSCKIIAVGYAQRNGLQVGLIARFNVDGTLDTQFGDNGSIFQSNFRQTTGITLQPNGQIVVVGTDASSTELAIARFNTDGSPDTSFGSNGTKTLTISGATQASAQSVQLLPDGQILVGGWATINGTTNFVIARFDANGGIDTSFGTSSGYTITPPPAGSVNTFTGMTTQSDGKIILASINTTLSEGILLRYNANGTVDTTYGINANGFVLLQAPGSTSTGFYSIVTQIDDKAVAAGFATINGKEMMLAARYLTNGTLDTSFGPSNNGTASFSAGGNALAFGLDIVHTIQGNGDLVLGGFISDIFLGLIRLNDSVKLIPDPVSCITQQIYNLYCGSC